jgi:tRNA pseudouridine55 synthase
MPKNHRIGHGGTLDPFATGVLVVLIGEATKIADAYLHSKKTYTGTITLGSQTDTADCTGTLIQSLSLPDFTLYSNAAVRWTELAATFVNEPYFQTPPMYSAKKKDGVALYDLARQGIEVERTALLKKIEGFKIYTTANPTELSFRVSCESGTYIRVLAEDLAKKAGTVAHLKTLCRSQSSDCELQNSISLDDLLQNPETITQHIRPLETIAQHVPSISISTNERDLLRNGNRNAVHQVEEKIIQFVSDRQTSVEKSKAPRYLLAKCDRQWVALFQLEYEPNEALHYRMQRIFN